MIGKTIIVSMWSFINYYVIVAHYYHITDHDVSNIANICIYIYVSNHDMS